MTFIASIQFNINWPICIIRNMHYLLLQCGDIESRTMEEVKLKRHFKLLQAVGILTGLIIGNGIYVSPTYVMRMVSMPGVTICMWVVAGCINILGSLTFVELGTTYTTIGDSYVFLDKFYGVFPAFLFLWEFLFLTRTGSNATKTLLAGA